MSAHGLDPLEAVLFRVLDVLDDAGVPYLLTGALVRNYLGGLSRTTKDFDIVVHPDHADADGIRSLFQRKGHAVEGPMQGNLGRRLVLRFEELWVDLWLPPNHPLHRSEFERAVRVIHGGRSLPLLHPEDYVLRKLVNYYRVRGKPNDIDDAYQVLLYAWDDVDAERLVQRAALYRIEARARELVNLVRNDRDELKGG